MWLCACMCVKGGSLVLELLHPGCPSASGVMPCSVRLRQVGAWGAAYAERVPQVLSAPHLEPGPSLGAELSGLPLRLVPECLQPRTGSPGSLLNQMVFPGAKYHFPEATGIVHLPGGKESKKPLVATHRMAGGPPGAGGVGEGVLSLSAAVYQSGPHTQAAVWAPKASLRPGLGAAGAGAGAWLGSGLCWSVPWGQRKEGQGHEMTPTNIQASSSASGAWSLAGAGSGPLR